jgi:hypothetical protein
VVNVTHGTGVDARHEHSRSTETERFPVPPAGANVVTDDDTVASQRVEAGAVTLVEVVAELPHAAASGRIENSRAAREVTSATVAQRSPASLGGPGRY